MKINILQQVFPMNLSSESIAVFNEALFPNRKVFETLIWEPDTASKMVLLNNLSDLGQELAHFVVELWAIINNMFFHHPQCEC